jgi:hypothetical protein
MKKILQLFSLRGIARKQAPQHCGISGAFFFFLFMAGFSFFSPKQSYGQNPLVKQWDARFGGSDNDYFHSLQQTADGGYILGGFSYSGISGDKTQASQGDADYWIVKTDAGGVKQWDARFGGSNYDFFSSLKQTVDGGYILGGYSGSGNSGDKTQASQGGTDYWIVKTDTGGVKQWDARFGGSDDDGLWSLQQTADGGYILGGYSESGISGDKTQASQGGYDYWIVKTDADAIPTETMFDPEDLFSKIFPNPVQNQLTIKMAIQASEVTIRVYDLQGKMIDLPTTIQNTQAQINTNALLDGFYTLQITNNKTGNGEVRMFVKQE